MAEERKAKICVIGEGVCVHPLISPEDRLRSSLPDDRAVGFFNYPEEDSTEYLNVGEVKDYCLRHKDKISAADAIIIVAYSHQAIEIIKALKEIGFSEFTPEKILFLIHGGITHESKEKLEKLLGKENFPFSLSEDNIKILFKRAKESYKKFKEQLDDVIHPEEYAIVDESEKPKLQSNKMRFFAYSGCALVAAGGVGALAFTGILTSPLFIIALTVLSVVAAIVFLVLAYRERNKEVRQKEIEMMSQPTN